MLAWIIGIHLVEANFLNPKIMGDAAKIHPVLVVFALIAGEHSYGLVGALFAVPVASIIQTIFVVLPPPPAASPAAPTTPMRTRRRARSERQRWRARRSAPTISAERSGTSCQPGRRGDVPVGLDRPRRATLRAGCGGRLRPAIVGRPWQTGQSEIPSTSR